MYLTVQPKTAAPLRRRGPSPAVAKPAEPGGRGPMEGLVFPTMGGEQEAQAVLATEEAAAAAALCQAAEPAAEKNGVAMFVVSNHWFSSWCHYRCVAAEPPAAPDCDTAGKRFPARPDAVCSGFAYDAGRKKAKVVPQQEPGPRPGPIDNSDLLAAPLVSASLGDLHVAAGHRGGSRRRGPPLAQTSSDLTSEQQAGVTVLRDKLVDRQHLWVVHEPTWNLLRGWYSCQGPEIRRQYHLAGRRMQLDVHQQHFRVIARPPDVETVVGCSAMVRASPACRAPRRARLTNRKHRCSAHWWSSRPWHAQR